MSKTVFNTLKTINVNEMTEKKGKFTYLSWAHAVETLKSNFPEATWTVHEFPLKLDTSEYTVPYMLDPMTGHAFVKVSVTVDDTTLEQVHPVLNHMNKPIPKPDAFAVNTAVMRCLAKAISLHGLGLYIYQGEDLPVLSKKEEQQAKVDEVYNRPETLLNGKAPVAGGITVDQNVKLDRLSREPELKGSSTSTKIREFIDTMPTQEAAEKAIVKLQTKIKQIKQKAKEAA